jgi:hypothetical protein
MTIEEVQEVVPGWISGAAGVAGRDFFVFRTVNGGRAE